MRDVGAAYAASRICKRRWSDRCSSCHSRCTAARQLPDVAVVVLRHPQAELGGVPLAYSGGKLWMSVKRPPLFDFVGDGIRIDARHARTHLRIVEIETVCLASAVICLLLGELLAVECHIRERI